MTVTQVNRLLRNAPLGCNISLLETIVPDGDQKELIIPCGVVGRVHFASDGCNVTIGAYCRSQHRVEGYDAVPPRLMHTGERVKMASAPAIGAGIEELPVIGPIVVDAVIRNGSVLCDRVVESSITLSIDNTGGPKIPVGVTLRGSRNVALSVKTTGIGTYVPGGTETTGQGYSVIVESCAHCTVSGAATNARYGVVFTGGGRSNTVLNFDGRGCGYAVEYHGGTEVGSSLLGVLGRVRLGNDAFLGTPQGLVINGMSVQTAGTSSGSLFVGNP